MAELAADPLDAMAAEARDLLRRVDSVIEQFGVPPGHPVVPLLRRLRMRPGEAWEAVWGTDPERLTDAAAGLRRAASWYRGEMLGRLQRYGDAVDWSGAGHDAFAADWATRMRELGGEDGVAGPAEALEATADYAEMVAGWLRASRRAVAEVMATVLPSVEAVTLTRWYSSGDAAGAVRTAIVAGDGCHRMAAAACGIGEAVLSGIEGVSVAGTELLQTGPRGGSISWASALAEIPDVPAERAATPSAATTIRSRTT